MQMQLPLFPPETKMLSDTWGVFEKDNMVYYIHSGQPVHIHSKSDIPTFRYIMAVLVNNHNCSIGQLSEVFGVNRKNIERYAQRLRDGGTEAFFNPVDNRGKCYKVSAQMLTQIQDLINAGVSQLRIAKQLNISESAIRYHLRIGNLKKKVG